MALEKHNEAPVFVGQTRDSILVRYGSPNRTVKLDGGQKYIEYKTTLRYRNNKHLSQAQACSVRFWYIEAIVTRVDYVGMPRACDNFLQSGTRNAIICQNGLLCFGEGR